MPECAEIRIMSDFVNYVVSNEKYYQQIEKSEVSKVKTPLDTFGENIFTIKAEARGKELRLLLTQLGGNPKEDPPTKTLLMTMGMSGNWMYVEKNSPKLQAALKHAHLRFISTNGNYLLLHDVRRFAKWKWDDNWGRGRGPCPLTQYEDFYKNIKDNLHKKALDAPLYEVLMNQTYFNGIGNYLRSEILYRLNVNPFQKLTELTDDELKSLLFLCYVSICEAYRLVGGKNPEWQGFPIEIYFDDWIKCYGKGMDLIDRGGRRFWYDPKWKDYINKIN